MTTNQHQHPKIESSTAKSLGKTHGAGTSNNQSSNSNSTDTKQAKHVIPPHQRDLRKIFVGGLGKEVNNHNFKQFFEQYGEVIDSVVMIDRETKRHRGFGFVTFQDAATASKVLAHGNEGRPCPPNGFRSGKLEIFGKVVEVKLSEPKKIHDHNRGKNAGNGPHAVSSKSSISSEGSSGGRVPDQIHFQDGSNGALSGKGNGVGYYACPDVGFGTGAAGVVLDDYGAAKMGGGMNGMPYPFVPMQGVNGPVFYPPPVHYNVPQQSMYPYTYPSYMYPYPAGGGQPNNNSMGPMPYQYFTPSAFYHYCPAPNEGNGSNLIPDNEEGEGEGEGEGKCKEGGE